MQLLWTAAAFSSFPVAEQSSGFENTEMLHFQMEFTGRRGLPVTASNLVLNDSVNNTGEFSYLRTDEITVYFCLWN